MRYPWRHIMLFTQELFMLKTDLQQIIRTFFIVLTSKLLSFYKLSFVVGSQAIFFSASNFCMPLVGSFGGITLTSIIWMLMLSMRLATASLSVATLALYIPGYCAALYLATQSRVLKFAIPFSCMILFVTHTVGMQAALYAVYWIIPCIIGMMGTRSFFMQALGATFTAHAVGSVIWLYAMPTAPALWLGLIPVVAIERFTFAAGMVVLQYALQKLFTAISIVWSTKVSPYVFIVR